jgi:hypothetical protein
VRKIGFLTAVITLMPMAASAAPLCHDLKGLYTPCPPGTAMHRSSGRHGSASAASAAGQASAAPDTAMVSADPARRRQPTKPPLVGRGKLCRDSKGLFKPC